MDSVQIYRLYSDTECLANRYDRAVREGKELLAAVEWCRYLVNAGILDLLAKNQHESVLRFDAAELTQKVQRVREEAQFQWTCSLNKPRIDLSEVESINRKLDAIAEWILKQDANALFKAPASLVEERKVIEPDFSRSA